MIRFTTRIHEAAGSDEARPVLTHVCVKGGFAYATDSYVLAKAPVEGGEEGLVPAEAVKKAWTSTGREQLSWAVAHADNAWRVEGKNAVALIPNGLPQDSHYPNADDLLQGTIDRLEHDGAETITFAVDVERLLSAARAINAGKVAHVRITVDALCGSTKNRPLLVRPLERGSEAVAIVMPMRQS